MAGLKSPQIPVIDISNPTLECGREIVDAAARSGFLYVKVGGSDIPPQAIDRAFELVR
jgi:hypothetical protein